MPGNADKVSAVSGVNLRYLSCGHMVNVPRHRLLPAINAAVAVVAVVAIVACSSCDAYLSGITAAFLFSLPSSVTKSQQFIPIHSPSLSLPLHSSIHSSLRTSFPVSFSCINPLGYSPWTRLDADECKSMEPITRPPPYLPPLSTPN